jgi:hypothetical protein
MSTYTHQKRAGLGSLLGDISSGIERRITLPKISLFGIIIVGALVAFEIFNYSTTEFALTDLLGSLEFAGVGWATILALAFCGMDFAGIARLFSPQHVKEKPLEIWYLLGAWFLAATMNAMLTWWAISVSLLQHEALGNEIINRETLLSSVPIFVALLVWLIRVLMIGAFTLSGARLITRGSTESKKRDPFSGTVVHTHQKTGSRGRAPIMQSPMNETVSNDNGNSNIQPKMTGRE